MNDINNLYKDMERSSFDYLIIDGYRYSIKKVLKYLKSIKNGRYNDNNKMEFYKKDVIDKTKRALNSTEKKSDSIKKIITYYNYLHLLVVQKKKILEVESKLMKQDLLKIKKEVDMLIYLFFYLKHILIIVQKN